MYLFRKLYLKAIKIKFITLMTVTLLFLILNAWIMKALEPQTKRDWHRASPHKLY
ncbi:hypothetical protein [Bacillus sp. SJS]|uniref:hypothetical protein n=1 Tax=Bacillus sp. SJS TaxID=1423321 RepID=UPI000B084A6C|nr:hypothetical protein [Bacillus sp. SJS]